jgi:hypothetical protein
MLMRVRSATFLEGFLTNAEINRFGADDPVLASHRANAQAVEQRAPLVSPW